MTIINRFNEWYLKVINKFYKEVIDLNIHYINFIQFFLCIIFQKKLQCVAFLRYN